MNPLKCKGMRGNTDVKPLTGNQVLTDCTGKESISHTFPVYTTAKAYRTSGEGFTGSSEDRGDGQASNSMVQVGFESLRWSRPELPTKALSHRGRMRKGGKSLIPAVWAMR